MLADRTLQIPGTAPVHLVEPEEGDGAPGDVDGVHVHLGQPDEIVGAGVGAQQGVVAPPAGRVQCPVVIGAAHRHTPGPGPAGILPLRVEKVGLGVLVNPQRNHVQDTGLGDLGDPLPGGLHRRQAKVMADQRKRCFPGDALDRGLGIVGLGHRDRVLALEVGQDRVGGFAAVEATIEKPDSLRPFGHRGCATKSKADARIAQIIGCLGKLGQ